MKLDNSILNNNLNELISYDQFFRAFGYTDNSKVFMRTIDDKKRSNEFPANHSRKLASLNPLLNKLHTANEEEDRGIFFIVNGGGHSDEEVKEARAQFIDFDDFPFPEQIERLNNFPLEPSIIIKTKKSLHCYWLLKDGDIKNFRGIQERLIQHFKSDPTIKNESRVMRLYGYEHRKTETPVMVTLIKFDPLIRYTQQEILDSVPAGEPMTEQPRQKTAPVTREGGLVPVGQRHNYIVKRIGEFVERLRGSADDKSILELVVSDFMSNCADADQVDMKDFRKKYLKTIKTFTERGKPENVFAGEFDTSSGEVDQGQAVINMLNSQLKQQPDKLYKSVGSEQESFDKYIREHKKRISTGFLELDKKMCGGLDNELYILGAETGQGKSAFSMQLAQNIASAGTDVLYFALEMSRRELIARGVSCYSDKFQKVTGKDPVTAGDILYFHYDELLEDFYRISPDNYKEAQELYFKECGERLFIVEAREKRLTVEKILETVKEFKKERGSYPVVFVDYLQMIDFSDDGKAKGDRKNKVDHAVALLKLLSYRTPVFTISSIGRVDYGKRITPSSFKESGDIEFTGGILIGLNFSPDMEQFMEWITDKKGDKKRVVDEEKLKRVSGGAERPMDIEILKFRNGEKLCVVKFGYHARYNNFICVPDEMDMYYDFTENKLRYC